MPEQWPCTAEASRVGAPGQLWSSEAETSTAAVTVSGLGQRGSPPRPRRPGPHRHRGPLAQAPCVGQPHTQPRSRPLPRSRGGLLRDFEDPQQPECPQNTDPKRGSWLDGSPHHFEDAPHDDLQGTGLSAVLHARVCAQLSPAHGCLSLPAPSVSLVCSSSHTGHCKPTGTCREPPGPAARAPCRSAQTRQGTWTERGQACAS